MKIMIISDIHGNADSLDKVIQIYSKERCNKLILLGDLFEYIGIKNRSDIIDLLNKLRENIICVRGNCDYNINGFLFDIPYIERVKLDKYTYTLTHGHLYNSEYLLNEKSNIILTGHTHIASIELISDKLFINPGSISRSRKGENSFSIIETGIVTIRNLDNKILSLYKIDKLADS